MVADLDIERTNPLTDFLPSLWSIEANRETATVLFTFNDTVAALLIDLVKLQVELG